MTRIRTDRNILMYVLLNIVTCGIYGYWFIYQLAQDVNVICRDDGKTTGGLAVFILLSIVTCGIYPIIWWYNIANRLQAAGPKYGVTIVENGTSFLLWYLLGMFLCAILSYVAIHKVLENTNTLAAAYNAQNGL